MQNLKEYLNDRRKFLQEVANADPSEDSLSTLGQIHEIKHILNWIDDHENAKSKPHTHTTTPNNNNVTESTPCNN